jgi:hypothetical protein
MRNASSSILAATTLMALLAGCREAPAPAPASTDEVVLNVPGMT